MVPLSTLTARLSDGLALPRQRVDLVARRMREAAALPTGTSGPHEAWKAHITPEDAVRLLLAVMSDCPATEAADTADRLAALPISEVLAIHPDGSTEIVLPGSAAYEGLTQSGDTLGAILTAHLETLVLDVACPGEIEVLSVNDQWPSAYISAVCNGLRLFVLCSRPRMISNAALAAMTKEARCGGVIFPYLARLYREGLQADYRAGQESEARA